MQITRTTSLKTLIGLLIILGMSTQACSSKSLSSSHDVNKNVESPALDGWKDVHQSESDNVIIVEEAPRYIG
ncbi:MAG: hypothetical protein H7A33_04535 [Deltaproteobacteria bacterium]|nr:hypothetical protein [Deltaproteobacteria bacterium]